MGNLLHLLNTFMNKNTTPKMLQEEAHLEPGNTCCYLLRWRDTSSQKDGF
jgi:hypothetical protein